MAIIYNTQNPLRFGQLWIENAGILPNIIASAAKNRYTGSFPICILGQLNPAEDGKTINISFAEVMFQRGVINGILSRKLHKQHMNDFHSFVNYLQNGVDSEILISDSDNFQNNEHNNPALMITKYYFALHRKSWTDYDLYDYFEIPHGDMQRLIKKCEALINYNAKSRFDIRGSNNSELYSIFQNLFDGPPPIKLPLDFPELSCIYNFGKISPVGFDQEGKFAFYTDNSFVNNIDENLPFGRIDIMRNIQKCVTDPERCNLMYTDPTEPILKDCTINKEEEKIKKFYGFATNKDLYSARLFSKQLGISNDEWELMDEINNLFHNGELQHESVVAFLNSKGVEEIKKLKQEILNFAEKMKDKGVPVVDPLINQLLGRINALPPPQPEQVNFQIPLPIKVLDFGKEPQRAPRRVKPLEPIEELNDNQESSLKLQEDENDEEQDEGQPAIPPAPLPPPEPPLLPQGRMKIPPQPAIPPAPLPPPEPPLLPQGRMKIPPQPAIPDAPLPPAERVLEQDEIDEDQEMGSGSELQEDILIPEYMYEEQDKEPPAIPDAPPLPPEPPLLPQGRMKIPPQPAIPPAPPLPPEPPLPPQERIKIPPQPAIPPEPPPKRELKPVRSIGNIPKSNPELLKNPPYQKPSSDTDINIEESKPININIEDDRMDSLSNQNFDTEDVQPNVSNNLQPITNHDNSQQQYNLKFLKHNIVKRSSNIGFSDIYLSIIISSLLILFGILGLLLIPASVVRNAVMATIITVGFVGTMFTAATVYYNRKANQSKIQKNARYDNQQKTQSLTVSQKSLNERNLINHPRHRNGFSSERQLN